METKVYLAGGLNQSDWQKKVIDKVGKKGFVYFNPREHKLSNSKEYAIWDLYYVKNCDIVFACMQRENPSGFGLTLEVGYAHALGKPIILVDEKSASDDQFARYFRIVLESSSIVFTDINEAIMYLKNFKNGIIMCP